MTTETERSPTSRLETFIDAMIDMGQTGQIFGEHGIGKTATFFSHVARGTRTPRWCTSPRRTSRRTTCSSTPRCATRTPGNWSCASW